VCVPTVQRYPRTPPPPHAIPNPNPNLLSSQTLRCSSSRHALLSLIRYVLSPHYQTHLTSYQSIHLKFPLAFPPPPPPTTTIECNNTTQHKSSFFFFFFLFLSNKYSSSALKTLDVMPSPPTHPSLYFSAFGKLM
jgi:hypothetical protein